MKSHSCNQRNFTIDELSSLINHTRVHSGKKPFVCTQCKYSANQSSTLRKNASTHSGEKLFNCRQCNYSCNNRSRLKNHMLTHIWEKPFSCSQFSFSCSRAVNLRTHIQIYTGAGTWISRAQTMCLLERLAHFEVGGASPPWSSDLRTCSPEMHISVHSSRK